MKGVAVRVIHAKTPTTRQTFDGAPTEKGPIARRDVVRERPHIHASDCGFHFTMGLQFSATPPRNNPSGLNADFRGGTTGMRRKKKTPKSLSRPPPPALTQCPAARPAFRFHETPSDSKIVTGIMLPAKRPAWTAPIAFHSDCRENAKSWA